MSAEHRKSTKESHLTTQCSAKLILCKKNSQENLNIFALTTRERNEQVKEIFRKQKKLLRSFMKMNKIDALKNDAIRTIVPSSGRGSGHTKASLDKVFNEKSKQYLSGIHALNPKALIPKIRSMSKEESSTTNIRPGRLQELNSSRLSASRFSIERMRPPPVNLKIKGLVERFKKQNMMNRELSSKERLSLTQMVSEMKSIYSYQNIVLNASPFETRGFAKGAICENKFIAIGGIGVRYFDECITYDIENKSYGIKKHHAFKRTGHSIASYDNFIIVYGGSGFNKYDGETDLRDVLLIDSRNLHHQQITSNMPYDMPQLKGHVSFVMQNKLYLHGGILPHNVYNHSIYSFDLIRKTIEQVTTDEELDRISGHTCWLEPIKDECKKFKKLYERRSSNHFQLAFVGEDQLVFSSPKKPIFKNRVVYLFGGLNPEGETSNCMKTLTLKKDRFAVQTLVTAGKQPPARYEHGMCYVESLLSLAVYGGKAFNIKKHVQETALNDLWLFNIKASTWVEVQTIGALPCRYSFIMANDGQDIVVFGGYTDNNFADGHLHKLSLKNGYRDTYIEYFKRTHPD